MLQHSFRVNPLRRFFSVNITSQATKVRSMLTNPSKDFRIFFERLKDIGKKTGKPSNCSKVEISAAFVLKKTLNMRPSLSRLQNKNRVL